MIKATYEQILERIANSSGLDKEEINRRVEAKRAKLSNLISKEGAAQVVAAEMGISFDNQKLKINEILDGMKKLSVVGKVIKIEPIRNYKKNEREGKVANMLLADNTGNVRVVLWDSFLINKIEKGEIKEGDTIEISSASVRNNEIHLVSGSKIELSNETIENVVIEDKFETLFLKDVKPNDKVRIRAYVIQIFEPRNFPICPHCGGKAFQDGSTYNCPKHGLILPNYRQIMSFLIDDGTENMRAVIFSENIAKAFKINDIEKLFDLSFFEEKKKEILGQELWFIGKIRQNRFMNTLELFVSDIEEVDIEKEIIELENKKNSKIRE